MADPLSITASTIAVAGLAYSSSKMLYQAISNIHSAPQTFVNLKTDIETLNQTIHCLQRDLEGSDNEAVLSEAQKANLSEINPVLEACHNACDAFKGKIDKLLRHSTDDSTSLRVYPQALLVYLVPWDMLPRA
jgi:hypothetical protein